VSPIALHKASFCTPLSDAIHQQLRRNPGAKCLQCRRAALGQTATWQQVRATSALPPQTRHALTRLARQFRANCGLMHRRKQHLYSITVRPSAALRLMANSNLVEARQVGQRPSPPNELRSWRVSGLSYRTTFNKELWISRFPLYLI
jgi:hypothetical protein